MNTPISASDRPDSIPVLRLLPKANARAIRRGAPWVFDNELVMDRRTRKIAPGTIAVLEDHDREAMGVVAVNPTSKIVARMLDRNPLAVIDRDWLFAKLTKAVAMRDRMYDKPFYRLVHAEGDGLPGVIIDRFGDTAVIQPNAAWAEMLIEDLADALMAATGVANVLKNSAGRGRTLEGLDDVSTVLRGVAPDAAVPVEMNGAIYMADLTGGQKTGLFFDQRDNHAFAARLSGESSVLDVFSHVGGFALAALANGAKSALAVDGSAPALELAAEGAKRMDKVLDTRQGDAFDVMSALADEKRKFDVVICDPPAFAPSKPTLEKGLRAYERIARLAAALVKEDGYLVLCSCSHAADTNAFTGACLRGIGRGGRRAQLLHTGTAGPDHPLLPQLAESGYLKALFFRL
ncbi:RSP_2647 family RNA methyltransferase [Pelagimonas varians]|uniref:Ribosomal RNA large subunit methyltransferase I n=1 Tax=Pelagimonas varians TaxID=696760 RepID=A0A238K806_9RHOB|nr:class I SAM-dependent rRNA methyltransferase [Pelagimonas varians]PYG31785.1 SAM-dependent methyltransferase [Pelagimonas varians]SMX38584.1 Ribosomal RNA large subunit methyltransferase I [Pelagimonas varians]